MVKTLPSLIASLRHYIALYLGNILPLPGTKRYVGREKIPTLFFTLHPSPPLTFINIADKVVFGALDSSISLANITKAAEE